MPPRSATLGQEGIWLLLLLIDGRPFRFGTRPVDVARENGRVDRWDAGLEDLRIGRNETSVAITIAANIDWALLVARGIDIAAGHATLYRYFTGQLLEEAEVLREGRVTEPEYDTIEDPLVFSIVEESAEATAVIPDPGATVDDTTWPVDPAFVIDDPAKGQAYPIIIGRPGLAGFSGVGIPRYNQLAAVSPAYLVELGTAAHTANDSKLLIAGHEVEAPTVTVYDVSDGSGEDFPVLHTSDLRGRTIAYVEVGTGLHVRPWPGHEYRVAWRGGGGLLTDDRSRSLRGANELILYLLGGRVLDAHEQTATRLDRGRQISQGVELDAFLVDAVINEPIDVWDWITRNLVPILPMTWRPREGYFQAWRYDATRVDATASLDADRGQIEPSSPVRVAAAKVYNRFVLEYAPGGDGSMLRRRVLTGVPDEADGDEADPSYLCQISQSREAARTGGNGQRTWTYRTDAISDPATARLVLLALARRYAVPPIEVSYLGGPELESLRAGDVVLVTHGARYWSERLAIVRDVMIGGPQPEVSLELIADPTRAPRSTQ
jgi:hypothetical protein